jgi:hypothetical protein
MLANNRTTQSSAGPLMEATPSTIAGHSVLCPYYGKCKTKAAAFPSSATPNTKI